MVPVRCRRLNLCLRVKTTDLRAICHIFIYNIFMLLLYITYIETNHLRHYYHRSVILKYKRKICHSPIDAQVAELMTLKLVDL